MRQIVGEHNYVYVDKCFDYRTEKVLLPVKEAYENYRRFIKKD